MVFKINIAEKSGMTFKVESDSEGFIGKELHDKISGKEISSDLEGYEFEITGTSDKSGFTSLKEIEGVGLSKALLSYEKGMKKRPKKEGKKKRSKNKPKGLRLRKTVRGKIISPDIVQINLKILNEGNKKLSEIFPEQNKGKVEPDATENTAENKGESKQVEKPKEEEKKENERSGEVVREKKVDEKKEEVKEEKPEEIKVK